MASGQRDETETFGKLASALVTVANWGKTIAEGARTEKGELKMWFSVRFHLKLPFSEVDARLRKCSSWSDERSDSDRDAKSYD